MRYLFFVLLTAAVVAGTGWVMTDNPIAEGWRDDLLPLPALARVGSEGNPGHKRKRRKPRRRPRTPPPSPAKKSSAAKVSVSKAQVHYELGLAYLHQKKVPAAITELKKCTALEPEHALAYRALGMAHTALGRQTSAVAAFERFVALAPEHRDAAKVRAIIKAHKNGQ